MHSIDSDVRKNRRVYSASIKKKRPTISGAILNPLPEIFLDQFEKRLVLRCPLCGSLQVKIDQRNSLTISKYRKASILARVGCPNNHWFDLVLQGHKDKTFVRVDLLEVPEAGEREVFKTRYGAKENL